MSKIIVIEKCLDCPFIQRTTDSMMVAQGVICGHSRFWDAAPLWVDGYSIPYACPLKDTEKP